jgi:hypothetical protein
MDLNKILNPVIGVAGLLSLALSATLALADSNEQIKIKVRTDDGISETVRIDNLEEGMTDVFVTESGKEVLVTRENGSLSLEVDGKVIDVNLPHVESLHLGDADGHQIAKRLMFISEDGEKHEFDGEGDHFFSCKDDAEECDTHHKTVWIDSDDMSNEMTIDTIDGANVIIKRIDHTMEGDVDVDELLREMEIDVEVTADGTEDHEVIVIKRKVEIHEDNID